jgi:fermentation-respiration switch protein FrsA (DUF1100 family)
MRLRAGLVPGLGILVLLVIPMIFEERFIYFPSRYPEGIWDVEALQAVESGVGLAIGDCWLRAEDGVHLHGWFCKRGRKGSTTTEHPAPEMVFLFFHGNGGNLTHRCDMLAKLVTLPVEVFIVDYRGYGRSEGRASEEGLYLDARAAWNFLVSERAVQPESIVIFGKSLGGAVAVDLATRVEPAGLIIQSSFTSIPDMAKRMIPILPRFFIRTQMDSVSKVSRIDCPKLFIHSPVDEVVPYELGRRLFEAASEPKEFYEVPSAPHNETYLVGGEAYLGALRRFVRSCAPG